MQCLGNGAGSEERVSYANGLQQRAQSDGHG